MTPNHDLATLLKPNEILTSTQLIQRLINSGLGATNARQVVRRGYAGSGMWRSEKLALASNGRLFAKRSFVGSPEFLNKVLPVLKENRPGLFRLAQRIQSARVVLSPAARMLLACPADEKKTRFPSFDSEIEALEEIGLGKREAVHTAGDRFTLKELVNSPRSAGASLQAQTNLQIEMALTSIIVDHVRRQNLISWNPLVPKEFRDGFPIFNNYPFCAATFSWLSPLVRWQKELKRGKPTPVVFHVVSGLCTEWDVDGFVSRMMRASHEKGESFKLFGIIAAPTFSANAWEAAKKAGLMTINFKQLFGESTFEAIVQVQELLKNVVGDAEMADDRGYAKLSKMMELNKTNPFIADLKALALETLAGLVIRNDGWDEVQLNSKAPFVSAAGITEREIDVSGQKNAWDQVCIVECKAEGATKALDPSYVWKFFTETVPSFLKLKCRDRSPTRCRAEIWTTGVIGESAAEAFAALALAPFINPKLIDREHICSLLPPTLKSSIRLVETIGSF